MNTFGPNTIQSIELSAYGEVFLEFLEKFYQKKGLGEIRDKEKIRKACIRMEEVHDGQTRKNNKPYNIHPYMVVRIYCLVHGKKISETGIIAAILHDNIENAKKSNKVENYDTIQKDFGEEDALICEVLSKKDIPDKKERNEEYFNRFTNLKKIMNHLQDVIDEKGLSFSSGRIRTMALKIGLIKLCDRIHNLRTMEDFSAEDIGEKIEETDAYLLPLARDIGATHPIVLVQLQSAMIAAQNIIIRKQAMKIL